MSKFDLEAAKRGEPVQILVTVQHDKPMQWVDGYFVGLTKDRQQAVVEYDALFCFPNIHGCTHIRMKPKKREMWAFPYKDENSDTTRMSRLFEMKESAEGAPAFLQKRVGEVQMILVDEE